MMTPPRHQRRGAGRQLLSTALAARWTAETTGALLVSTVAGRRLYESLGFVARDEVIACYRGLDKDVLDAMGQLSL
jgi:ribosomal protein S18 acetylase RimI-like enzyme